MSFADLLKPRLDLVANYIARITGYVFFLAFYRYKSRDHGRTYVLASRKGKPSDLSIVVRDDGEVRDAILLEGREVYYLSSRNPLEVTVAFRGAEIAVPRNGMVRCPLNDIAVLLALLALAYGARFVTRFIPKPW